MSLETPSFPRLVSDAMARRGIGLRELCRRAEMDPSFLSKVLSGKRNPPSEEKALRRVAVALELDPVEVIVSAGLIPTDWCALWSDPELVRAVHAIAAGGRPARSAAAALPATRSSRADRGDRPAAARAVVSPSRDLAEELL